MPKTWGHSVEAQLPACHQVGRQDQVKLFDAELANWGSSKQLLTLWFLLSLYYPPLRSPLKSYFFRNCQYCWRHPVGDGGNFVPNSGWTEKCTISKCIFSLSKNIDPQFFLQHLVWRVETTKTSNFPDKTISWPRLRAQLFTAVWEFYKTQRPIKLFLEIRGRWGYFCSDNIFNW